MTLSLSEPEYLTVLPLTSEAVTQLLPDFFCRVIVMAYDFAVAEKIIAAPAAALVLLILLVVNPTEPVLYVELVSAKANTEVIPRVKVSMRNMQRSFFFISFPFLINESGFFARQVYLALFLLSTFGNMAIEAGL